MRKLRRIALLCSLTASLLSTVSRTYGAPASQAGEIHFETGGEDLSAARIQDSVIEKFEQIASTKSAGSPFSSNEILYLNGVYLYCSIQAGACPLPLDALLEVDLLAAQGSSCPNLTEFWRSWMKNGLEDRHRYNIKTANIATTADFSSKTRPRYIRCADTVASERKRPVNFSRVGEFTEFMKSIRERKLNVFPAAQSPNAELAPTKNRAKKKESK